MTALQQQMLFKTLFVSNAVRMSECSPRHCEERSDEAIHLSWRGEMDCFAALAMTRRVAFSRRRAQTAFGMEIAQLALEDLAAGLARQGVEKLNVLRHLEVGKPSAQEFLHRARR